MKLSTQLMYSGNPREAADQVVALEQAGLDTVWVPEAYGFDSPTLMGYLAAKTERVEIGSAILNIYSRTPGALLQTAAGLDNVSQGRAILGLGASGPQVIEGFHGVPYDKPLARTREIVDLVRRGLRRETLRNEGLYTLPLPEGQGTGLGKPLKLLTDPNGPPYPSTSRRSARRTSRRRRSTPTAGCPSSSTPSGPTTSGATRSPGHGQAARGPRTPGGLGGRHGRDRRGTGDQGAAGLRPAVLRPVRRRHGRARQELLQRPGLPVRLPAGGQGDPGPLPRRSEADAEAKVPLEWLEATNLVGPATYVRERIAAYAEAASPT